MTISIRVLNFCGDRDDLNDLNLIGPYPTAEARDRDIRRLDGLPDVYGSLTFEPSQQNPNAAEHACTPEKVAAADSLDGVLIALRIILPPLPENTDSGAVPLPGLETEADCRAMPQAEVFTGATGAIR